jgi:hypothetical protein
MHTLLKGTLVAAGAFIMAGPAIAQDDSGRRLSAALVGAEEPAGGDEDGSGSFSVRINPGQEQLCYTLTASGIEPANAAHIHEGELGVAGPVVVPLTAPTGGSSTECVSVARDLALELIRDPEAFYVNVHNVDFPGGAIRGQLSK